MSIIKKIALKLRVKNELVKDMLAEFFGTFVLCSFAIGASCQYVLTKGKLASFLTLNLANGVGLVFGVYTAGGVSGASLNPATTIALCLHGLMDWYKFPFYSIAELAGAFFAAAVQYRVNIDMLNAYDGGNRTTSGPTETASLFSTFPNPDVSTMNCLWDQIWSTFLLIVCVFAVIDKKNFMPLDKGLLPISFGTIVFGIGACWAGNCGYPLNPARDLGPRLFTAIAGWGIEPFSYRDYNWFWVPLVGPCIGASLAYFAYMLFIELHWEPEAGEEPEQAEIVNVVNHHEKIHNHEMQGMNNPAFVSSEEFAIRNRHFEEKYVEKFYRDYNWFWVPLVGPCIGASLAYFAYMLFIELHWEPEAGEEPEQAEIVNVVNHHEKIHNHEMQGMNNPAFVSSEEFAIRNRHFEEKYVEKL